MSERCEGIDSAIAALRAAVTNGRSVFISPEEAAQLIDVLPPLGTCRVYRHGAGDHLPHPKHEVCVDWKPLP